MPQPPEARWTNSEDLADPAPRRLPFARRGGPPTPAQRRLGTRLALGIMVLALLVIFLLDHYGILH